MKDMELAMTARQHITGAVAVLVLTLGAALVTPPRIALTNPQALYAVAVYKSLVGDADAAREFVQRAVAAKRAAQPSPKSTTRNTPAQTNCPLKQARS